jgi:hypothetical protein
MSTVAVQQTYHQILRAAAKVLRQHGWRTEQQTMANLTVSGFIKVQTDRGQRLAAVRSHQDGSWRGWFETQRKTWACIIVSPTGMVTTFEVTNLDEWAEREQTEGTL